MSRLGNYYFPYVTDWDIVSSEEDDAFARDIKVWVENNRFGPRVSESDPAPYALRVTFVFAAPGAPTITPYTGHSGAR